MTSINPTHWNLRSGVSGPRAFVGTFICASVPALRGRFVCSTQTREQLLRAVLPLCGYCRFVRRSVDPCVVWLVRSSFGRSVARSVGPFVVRLFGCSVGCSVRSLFGCSVVRSVVRSVARYSGPSVRVASHALGFFMHRQWHGRCFLERAYKRVSQLLHYSSVLLNIHYWAAEHPLLVYLISVGAMLASAVRSGVCATRAAVDAAVLAVCGGADAARAEHKFTPAPARKNKQKNSASVMLCSQSRQLFCYNVLCALENMHEVTADATFCEAKFIPLLYQAPIYIILYQVYDLECEILCVVVRAPERQRLFLGCVILFVVVRAPGSRRLHRRLKTCLIRLLFFFCTCA